MTVDTITKNAGLDPDWREDASCRQVDPQIFYPTTGEWDEMQAAKAVCRRCPAIESCAVWVEAYEAEQPEYHTDGVWAAMSANERSLRRKLRRQAAA